MDIATAKQKVQEMRNKRIQLENDMKHLTNKKDEILNELSTYNITEENIQTVISDLEEKRDNLLQEIKNMIPEEYR